MFHGYANVYTHEIALYTVLYVYVNAFILLIIVTNLSTPCIMRIKE